VAYKARFIRGPLVAATALAAVFWATPAARATSTGYSCLGSVGDRRLDGPTNDGVPGEWVQGDASTHTNWIVGCSYPGPGDQWGYEVAWTPLDSVDYTREGCGDAKGLSVIVSPDHWAYANATPSAVPAVLAAAEGQLAAVAGLATPCAPTTTTPTVTPDTSAPPDTSQPADTTTAPPQTTTAPPAPSTTTASPAVGPIIATITSIVGDVSVKPNGATKYVPASVGMVLRVGDYISTDVGSEASLTIGTGQLTVREVSLIRINETIVEPNLQKIQVRLNQGRADTAIPERNLIRTDFSVQTPVAVAAIRGSAMVVSVAKDGVTTVSTTRDESFVQGVSDPAPLTIPLGQMSIVGSDGRASPATTFSASALAAPPVAPRTPSPFAAPSGPPVLAWTLSVMAIAAVIVGGVLLLRRRRPAREPA
jgi:hypothetical protein